VSVAIALGLGTMIGWKRIVITVGEKIGKTHLTYGQGAPAELVAAAHRGGRYLRFAGFDHPCPIIGCSGGLMAANGSGLQLSTIRNNRAGMALDPCRWR